MKLTDRQKKARLTVPPYLALIAMVCLGLLAAATSAQTWADKPTSLDDKDGASAGSPEPLRIGEKVPVRFEMFRQAGKVQVHEFRHAGASYIKLHFAELNLEKGDVLVISNPDRTERHVYPEPDQPTDPDQPGEKANNERGFWALSIDGDTAIIELTLGDAPRGLPTALSIDTYAYGYPWLDDPDEAFWNDGEKSICGDKDHDNVACYESSHPVEYARSRAVAVVVLDGDKICTAWRIGPSNHMLTNEHCITSQADVDDTEVWFNYQRRNCNGLLNRSKTKVTGDDLLLDNFALDFALFTVNNLQDINHFGFLLPDPRALIQDEEIYIPGHPKAKRKRLSIDSDENAGDVCRIDVPVTDGPAFTGNPADTDTGYFCDTEQGSSGSPVLARSSHRVVALHHSGGCTNQGVLMSEIWPLIEGFVPLEEEFTVDNYGGSMWFEGSDATNTPVAGDFDNNGFDDIAYRGKCGGGAECWRVHLNDGNSFSVANFGGNMWFEGSDATNTPVVGDFDNNDFDDIAYRGKCGGGAECWRVHLSNGTSFSVANFGGNMWFEGSDATNTPVAGDFNNDDFDDIAYRGKCGGGTQCWRVHLSNGNSFSTAGFGNGMWFEGSDATNTPVAGDFNNDDFDDIAYRGMCGGGGGTQCWRVHLSNGTSFSTAGFGNGMWFEGSDATNTPVAADFDGNGFDDIAYYGFCGPGMLCWRMHLSDGTSFFTDNYGGSMWFEGSDATNRPVAGNFNTGNDADIGYRGKCGGGSGTECWRMHLH